MPVEKKNNDTILMGGLAVAALLGGLFLMQKNKANAASSTSVEDMPDTAAVKQSTVSNSIDEEDAKDAQKDEGYDNEDTPGNSTSSQSKSQNYPSENEEEYLPQPTSTVKKPLFAYSDQQKAKRFIGNGKPKMGESKQDIAFRQRQRNNTPLPQKKQNPNIPATQKAVAIFPLKLGSRNNQVVLLQKKLGIAADGIFGKITEATLVARFKIRVVANQLVLSTILLSRSAAKVAARKKVITKKVVRKITKKPIKK